MMDWGNPVTYVAIIAAGGVLVAIGKWVGGMEEFRKTVGRSIDEIKADIDKIKADIDKINAVIKEIFKRLPPVPITGESPVRLTDFGKKISDRLEAKEWAQQLAPSLSSQIQGKAEFEIYEFCGDYLQENLSEAWERKIAAGAYEFATDKNAVLSVLKVELRDALLSLAHTPEPMAT